MHTWQTMLFAIVSSLIHRDSLMRLTSATLEQNGILRILGGPGFAVASAPRRGRPAHFRAT